MNLDQIKEYIKENERLYDKETIKKRLRNNGAKPEDIKKAYSVFSFPEFKIEDEEKAYEEIQNYSVDTQDFQKNKNIIIALILVIFGFGFSGIGLIFAIVALSIVNKELRKNKDNQFARVVKIIAITSLVISGITIILMGGFILDLFGSSFLG